MKRIISIFLIIISINFIGCKNDKPTPSSVEHVPVKITKIQQTDYLKGMFHFQVEYKSEEYGLTHSVTIGNNETYANECYMGQYKVGDTIYAVMYTYKQEDTTKRELGKLDYNKRSED